MIKEIVKNLKPSSTLRINELSKDLELQGKEIFKFGFGQSPFKVPEDVILELKKNAHHNKYLPMQGLPELRNAIAQFESKKKQNKYDESNIIIGPGSKELMFLLHILFDGEVLLPAPSWVSYKPQAILGRNKYHFIETSRERNWFPSAESIENIVSKNNFFMKEHNADYLTDHSLTLHPKLGIHAANIAPEFGVGETKALIKILKENKGTVIALGGGSFENDKTRSLILKDNFSIWLKCSLKTLSYRCSNLNTRPLLKGKNIRNEISKLDKIRKKNYMKSNLIVDVSRKTKSTIIQEIVNNLKNE